MDGNARSKAALKQAAYRARKAEAKRAAVEVVSELLPPVPVQQALPLAPVGVEEAEVVKTFGRPRGGVSRRAEDWRQFFLARYGSPLLVLAETYSRPVEELARELGCKLPDAFAIQMRAAAELAPYLHAKAPLAVSTDGALVAPIMLGVTPAMAAKLGMSNNPMIEVVQDQGLSSPDPAQSDEGQSDER